MELERAKKAILETLFEYLHPDKLLVFLFGSRVDSQKPSSDIDLLLFYTMPLEDETFLALQEKLNMLEDVPCKIDLLEGRALNENFLKEALSGARIWHIGNAWIKNLKTFSEP